MKVAEEGLRVLPGGKRGAKADRAENFGTFLRAAREQKGWSRRAMADKMTYAVSALESLESGRTFPSVEVLAHLITLFDWDANRVMAWFGAREVKGIKGLLAEVESRPRLTELVEIARSLDPDDLEYVITTTNAVANRRQQAESRRKATRS